MDEIQCPKCVKIYQFDCDNITDPFNENENENEDYEIKNICDQCLHVLAYCSSCNVN